MLDTPMTMTLTDDRKLKHYPSRFRAQAVIFSVFCACVLAINSIQAQADSAEITPLSFGRFVVANNGSVSTLRVRHDGRAQVVSGSIYPIEFGTAGEYYLSGYPAFTPLTISISGFDLSTDGPTEEFTISDFTFEDVTTDENGEATLIVGATISTSGNGNSYVNSTYDATINITITF